MIRKILPPNPRRLSKTPNSYLQQLSGGLVDFWTNVLVLPITLLSTFSLSRSFRFKSRDNFNSNTTGKKRIQLKTFLSRICSLFNSKICKTVHSGFDGSNSAEDWKPLNVRHRSPTRNRMSSVDYRRVVEAAWLYNSSVQYSMWFVYWIGFDLWGGRLMLAYAL